MTAYIRQRPPSWYWAVASLLLLWGLMGCGALYAHVTLGAAMTATPDAWERAYDAALPVWFTPVYFVAIFGGVFGSIALLIRSKYAHAFYIASLAAVIVQFGYCFALTDMIAHKGVAGSVPFPLFIAAVAVFQIWFAAYARRRGWIV